MRLRRCCERLRVDRHAAAHLLDSLRHDSLTGLQSLRDNPVRAYPLADLNRTYLNFIIAADDGDLVVALQLAHGFLGNNQRTFACRYDCANVGVLAGTKHISGVRENTLNAQCAGFHIDLAVDQSSLPFVGINRPIRQNHLQAQMALIFIGVFFNVVQVFPLAYGEVNFDGIDRRNGRKKSTLGHEVADLRLGNSGNPVDE